MPACLVCLNACRPFSQSDLVNTPRWHTQMNNHQRLWLEKKNKGGHFLYIRACCPLLISRVLFFFCFVLHPLRQFPPAHPSFLTITPGTTINKLPDLHPTPPLVFTCIIYPSFTSNP